MKKLLLFLLLLGPLFLFGQETGELGIAEYQDSIYIRTTKSKTHSVWGVYYNGSAWIFHNSYDVFYPNQTLLYSKIKITADGTGFGKTEFIKDTDGYEGFVFPYKTYNSPTTPCAVVYKGLLFLYWLDKDDNIMFSHTDGETWTDPVSVGVTASGKNLATTVMNNTLYLLKQNIGGGIKLMKSTNGEDWSNAKVVFTNADSPGTSSLALATYFHDKKNHLLLGINPWKDYILTESWDSKNGLFNDVLIPGAKAKGISLVTGRTGVFSEYRFLPVQCYYLGTDGDIRRSHFNPNNDETPWTTPKTMGEMKSSLTFRGIPSAFSNFNFISQKRVEKQIWLCMDRLVTSIPDPLEKLAMDKILSEDLKRTETKSTDCVHDTTLWTLIGVVEGPPPFVLNGQTLDPTEPPSSFTYGTTASTEVVNSSDWTLSTSTSLKVPLLDGILTCGIDLSAALSREVKTSYASTYTEAHSVMAGNKSLGYYYFERPTITRYKYSSFTPSPFNENMNEYQYIFAVTGSTIVPVPFKLKRFDTHDITSYVGKQPSPTYNRISHKGFSWTLQTDFESVFSVDTSKEVTTSSSIGIGVSGGVEEIFDVGVNYEITLSNSNTTHFGQSITIHINNPAPRDGVATDVSWYEGTAYWLKANNSKAWWIPNGHKDQRPWCVTWSVDSIQYNNATGVAGLQGKKFALSQNYPNPFNQSTTIQYAIEKPSQVSLCVYNIMGVKVATLVNNFKSSGKHTATFDATGLPAGIYTYQIKVGNYTASHVMNLMK